MNDEVVRRLEEKIAFLEHHVTEQDKVMLEMGDEIRRLKQRLQLLGDRLGSLSAAPGEQTPDAHERPPHY